MTTRELTPEQERWARLLAWLLVPFPGGGGFSAYRMPGPSVHLAFIALTTFVGSALCSGADWFWLVVIWALPGVYFGRDLTIQAHYNPLIAIPGVLLFIGELVAMFGFGPRVGMAWHALEAGAQAEPALALLATAVVALSFVLRAIYVFRGAVSVFGQDP